MTLTAEQHAAREKGIGGSDAPAVLGLSPWRTPYEVWTEKTTGEISEATSNAMHWGSLLEPVLAEEYARVTGRKVRRVNSTLQAAAYPFMLAHIDRQVLDGERILECKTTRDFDPELWGEPGTDQIPTYYLAQVTHYMIVTGRELCDLAVLGMLSRDFRIYTCKLDHDVAARVIDLERKFWQRVEDNDPPPPITAADLRAMFPNDDGGDVTADAATQGAIDKLREVREEQKRLDEEQRALEQAAKQALGDHATLLDPYGDVLATWKTQTSRRFDTTAFREAYPDLYEEFREPSTSRVFRLKQPKGA